MLFEPEAIRVHCGHFIGGRLVPEADALTVNRPLDARPHAGMPVADAATVDAGLRAAAAWDVPLTGEGLALAAHEHDGFACGVNTADIGRARRALRGIAGAAGISRDGHSHDFAISTGGYRQSEIGKNLGRQAVEANLRFKSVLIDFDAAPAAVAVSARAAFHAVAGHANDSFGAAGAANRHTLARHTC